MFPENLIHIYCFGWSYVNERYEAQKYSFGLQKGIKNQKYFSKFGKYDVSAFQRTFDHVHIFEIGEATSD